MLRFHDTSMALPSADVRIHELVSAQAEHADVDRP